MKRVCVPLLFLLVLSLAKPVAGADKDVYMIGIHANHNAVEAFGEMGLYLQPSTMYFGANGLYYENRYAMLGVHAMIGNVVHRGLTGKIGFKGVAGELKRSGNDNPDILALAFSISGSYNLSDVIVTHYVPVILHATLSISPKPLSFDDTELFLETVLGVDWMILENAAITGSFRYLYIDFDDLDRSHGSGYLGFKFVF